MKIIPGITCLPGDACFQNRAFPPGIYPAYGQEENIQEGDLK